MWIFVLFKTVSYIRVVYEYVKLCQCNLAEENVVLLFFK